MDGDYLCSMDTNDEIKRIVKQFNIEAQRLCIVAASAEDVAEALKRFKKSLFRAMFDFSDN